MMKKVPIFIFVIVLLTSIHLYISSRTALTGYENDAIRKRLVSERSANKETAFEVSKLETPDRVEKIARSQLGMVYPSKLVYVTGESGSR